MLCFNFLSRAIIFNIPTFYFLVVPAKHNKGPIKKGQVYVALGFQRVLI